MATDREELEALVRAVREARDEGALRGLLAPLLERATHDGLTGLLNRARLDQALEVEVARARRHSRRLALVLLDLDDLKQLNDREGHAAGDSALRAAARALHERARRSDCVARWGGDELAALLPETGPEGALSFARDVVARLRERDGVALCAGVATLPDDASDAKTLVGVADRRLYAAKRAAVSVVGRD